MSARTLTKAPPKTIDGITFRCYRTGILQSAWYTDDNRCIVYSNHHKVTYSAIVDGAIVGRRYRTHYAAMKACAASLKKREAA